MERSDLAQRLARVSRLRGRFLLRSGAYSDEYFDKYRFAATPRLLSAVAAGLGRLIPHDVDIIAGVELGGVVIATAVSLAANKPVVFVRKARKEYGTQNIVEGAPIDGKTVCVIEDVISTGGQLIESTLELRQAGARVSTAICVVDRTGGDHRRLAENSVELRSLFTAADLSSALDEP
jgi:orotate phosphoribosyltransferase